MADKENNGQSNYGVQSSRSCNIRLRSPLQNLTNLVSPNATTKKKQKVVTQSASDETHLDHPIVSAEGVNRLVRRLHFGDSSSIVTQLDNHIPTNTQDTIHSSVNNDSVFEVGESSANVLGKSLRVPEFDLNGVNGNDNVDEREFSDDDSDVLIDFDNASTIIEEQNLGHSVQQKLNKAYCDFGDPEWSCQHCGAMFWYRERIRKERNSQNPIYSLCCMHGKVRLPKLKDPPVLLKALIDKTDSRSKNFVDNIRAYNMMFSFTSMGGKVDSSINRGGGPYSFRLQGQNYHRIGSMLLESGERPKFSQLHIYDTENEVSNRTNSLSSTNGEQRFDASIVSDLKTMLDEHNKYASVFRSARERFGADYTQGDNVKLILLQKRDQDGRTYNLPTNSEVAALIVGDIENVMHQRDIIIEKRSNGVLKRIFELHPSYLPLQYPLLFPYGEDGFRLDIPLTLTKQPKSSKARTTVSMREWVAFRIQERVDEGKMVLMSRRLLQQFVVDAYTMIESDRLRYNFLNQKQLRVDDYSILNKTVESGETDPIAAGKRIVLPSSFTGGCRYKRENYQDAMAICRVYGFPNLFITFTCNPKWPEIQRFVKARGLNAEDRPDIVCRVFKMKLDELVFDLKNRQMFGKSMQVRAISIFAFNFIMFSYFISIDYLSVIYTVEFQKRGLPHAHVLLFLDSGSRITANEVDNIISAEIPSEDDNPELHELVKTHMMHGPCGYANPKSPCMRCGRCTKRFPKTFAPRTVIDQEGYPIYRRRDNGITVIKGQVDLDNRFVVPYNPRLLLKYQAHINVELCNQTGSIKYLFKYVNKGPDRVSAKLCSTGMSNRGVNEIKEYLDCRYVSACEAVWRIFKFDINYRSISVQRLSFHLPNEHPIVFNEVDSLEDVVDRQDEDKSMFAAWMRVNNVDKLAENLTYAEFPGKYAWKKETKSWAKRRIRLDSAIGRIHHVPPNAGEPYYMRILLNIVKGPKSFEAIRSFRGVVYDTFKDACHARGLLGDDREYIEAIEEAHFWGSGSYLRSLFATLLFSESLINPGNVWDKTWEKLSDGILHGLRASLNLPDMIISEAALKEHTLLEIDNALKGYGKSLKNYPSMPHVDTSIVSDGGLNRLVQDELCFDCASLMEEHQRLFSCLTSEQRNIYEEIMGAVHQGRGGVFFLYGHGGTGKTFMWRTLASSLRSKGEIALLVASSGIAALLLPLGRTGHSRFGIPIQLDEDSICNIKPGYPVVELIWKAKLIIWDEAPMVHRHCFEALDRTLRDVLRRYDAESEHLPFGGKVIVFGGDFRQILPVVPKGSRADIVNATITSSPLWKYCKVLRLTVNMRLHSSSSPEKLQDISEFADWVLKMGDGQLGDDNDGEALITIPNEFLITDFMGDPINAIVRSTYPDLLDHLNDATYFQQRAILAPTNDIVNDINDYMLGLLPGEEKVYLSCDSICKSDRVKGCQDEELYSTEYLNSLRCSGLPNHQLKLKVGAPVMLLRNLDCSAGLCNGTRLRITKLGSRVLEAEIITGSKIGSRLFIPRLTLTPSDTRLPFKFQRRQFPLALCFAMTINKSQGQSLSHVGVYLPKSVFTHGQLYVGTSRVTNKEGLKFLIMDDDGNPINTTVNVVYKEVFSNIE